MRDFIITKKTTQLIKFKNINKSQPYLRFQELYNMALKSGQESIEAMTIATFSKASNEVNTRYVNLKYIYDKDWIFFSNYNSAKASDINGHDQIAASFYWSSINVQIRIKATAFKTNNKISDEHYKKRKVEKNALAYSSNQSKPIESYEEVNKNFINAMKDVSKFKERPIYWGGYSFRPYYFEFWEGHESRINKREVFDMTDGIWKQVFLQP